MSLNGNKTGSLNINVNCGSLPGVAQVPLSAPGNPSWGITAPAALSGTMTSGTFTIAASGTATFAGTEKVAVFWTAAGVNYYRYDCTIAAGGPQNTFAISAGAGTALPTGGQAVLVATNQDITDDVSITGNNVVQLLVTSTQPALVEWLNATPAQDHLSYITAANGIDTWPGSPGLSAPPANWTGTDVVVTLRCWNFSTNTANIQIACLLT